MVTGVAICGARCCANSGGSSSTVYSLNNLPLGQVTSTKKVKNGSRTGSLEVTCMAVPPPGSAIGLNFNWVKK